jgi:hypothetical protein
MAVVPAAIRPKVIVEVINLDSFSRLGVCIENLLFGFLRPRVLYDRAAGKRNGRHRMQQNVISSLLG